MSVLSHIFSSCNLISQCASKININLLPWPQYNNPQRKECNRERATMYPVMIPRPRPCLFNTLPFSLTSRASVCAHGIGNQLRFCAPASRTLGRAQPVAAHRCLRTGRGFIPTRSWCIADLFCIFYRLPFVTSSLWEGWYIILFCAMEKMSRPLLVNPTFLPPTHGVLKSLLENPMKLPFHHDDGKWIGQIGQVGGFTCSSVYGRTGAPCVLLSF